MASVWRQEGIYGPVGSMVKGQFDGGSVHVPRRCGVPLSDSNHCPGNPTAVRGYPRALPPLERLDFHLHGDSSVPLRRCFCSGLSQLEAVVGIRSRRPGRIALRGRHLRRWEPTGVSPEFCLIPSVAGSDSLMDRARLGSVLPRRHGSRLCVRRGLCAGEHSTPGAGKQDLGTATAEGLVPVCYPRPDKLHRH